MLSAIDLQSALNILLDPLGLGWTIDGDTLRITTRELVAQTGRRALVDELRRKLPKLTPMID